jgi:hypothetical protein
VDAAAELLAAVRNNAELCDAVCRAHGLPGEFHATYWVNTGQVPNLYPNLITLAPDVTEEVVADALGARPDVSVKDSFATLDLSPLGFKPLFDATWIASQYGEVEPRIDLRWDVVDNDVDLADWETAWAGGTRSRERTFPTAALRDGAIAFYWMREDGQLLAGALTNYGGRIYGISNVFAEPRFDPWPSLIADLHQRRPGDTFVGYESGDDLVRALAAGFRAIGPLRIWAR